MKHYVWALFHKNKTEKKNHQNGKAEKKNSALFKTVIFVEKKKSFQIKKKKVS